MASASEPLPLSADDIRQFQTPIDGKGIPSSNLAETLEAEPLVILYFLRHFGCIHCRYIVERLHELKQTMPRFPAVIFVHMEPLEEGEAFFAERFPGARHISDPHRRLYQLFGIRRASLGDVFTTRLLGRSLKRFLAGYRQSSRPTADPRTLSGMFLLKHGEPKWAHRAGYAGDDDKAYQMMRMLGKNTQPAQSEQQPAAADPSAPQAPVDEPESVQ